MERATWTDERLDDLAHRVDAGFERVDRDIRHLETGVRGEIEALRQTMLRVGGGMMVGFLTVLAAIIART